VLTAVLAAAAGLGSLRLGTPPLSLDEAVSWFNSSGTWARLYAQAVGGHDLGGILHSAALKLAMKVTGDSEVALRLLSVAAMVGLVAAMAATARALWDERAAIGVAVVTLIHPSVLASGRQARGYVLVLLFTGLCLLGLAWQWRGMRRASRVVLACASLAVASTHVLGAAVVAGVAAASAAFEWSRHSVAGGRVAQAARSLVPFVPALVFVAAWQAVIRSTVDRRLTAFWIQGSWLENYGVVALLLIVPLAAGAAIVARGDRSRRGRFVVAGLAVVAAPVVCVPGMLSVLARGGHNFVTVRYFYALIPLGTLACGYAISRLTPRTCAWLLLVAGAVSVSYAASKHLYSPIPRGGQDVRAAAAFLRQAAPPAERVVVVPEWEWCTLAYYGVGTVATPPDAVRRVSWLLPTADAQSWTVMFEPHDAGDALASPSARRWNFGTLQIVRRPARK
jgi:hypothetical protein